ncbi:MAG: hypothetical protein GX335_07320 [Firmicutes bacterium]|nr:hypothetical protein [Bacillota bacterium]
MTMEKQIFRSILILTITSGLGIIWFRFPIGSGLLLGGLTAGFAFRLLSLDAEQLLKGYSQGDFSSKNFLRHHWKGFLKRCFLYAVALTISILNPHVNFLAALAGLLLPRLAIYYHLFKGRIERGD